MIECIGLSGHEALPYVSDLAELRCGIFREYPYLYDGDASAESEYLKHYTDSDDVFFAVAKSGENVIGVSTCMWMGQADEAFKRPFVENGWNIEGICYFGESVLLPEYRGMGLGHRFFDLREEWAAKRGLTKCVFCAVVRPDDHSRKPLGYRPHDDFWRKRSYNKMEDYVAHLEWKEIDDEPDQKTMHDLVFWMREV